MDRVVRQVFANFGCYLLEFFRYQRALTRVEIEKMFLIQGFEYLEHALEQGKGALLLTAHFGNWEMGAACLGGLGHPLHVVALPMADPRVNQLFMARRRSRGMEIVEPGRAARSCIEQLRENKLVAVLGDRDFSPSRETTLFFGRPARIPRGPVRLAMLAGSPILPGVLIRLPGGRFHLRLFPAIGPFDRSQDTDEVMSLMADGLEKGISMAPEQWFIFHHFWDLDEDFRRSRPLPEKTI
jgi:KDO2-lipid IV(A) lauroyltransferase